MRSSSGVDQQPLGIFLPSKWPIRNVESWAAYHDVHSPTAMQSRASNASSEVLSSWYGMAFPSISQMTTPTRTMFSLHPETSMPIRVHHDSPITSRCSFIVSRAYSVVAEIDLVSLPSVTAIDSWFEKPEGNLHHVPDNGKGRYLCCLSMCE